MRQGWGSARRAAPCPLWAAGLPAVLHSGSARERRAVAVLAATAGSLLEQIPVLQAWGAADALRGGRFTLDSTGAIGIDGVRLVLDGRVSGGLIATDDGFSGDWRVSSRGVADGRVRVVLPAAGGGRITGGVGTRRVDVSLG